jgi:putrescine transport system substrate-binding protein
MSASRLLTNTADYDGGEMLASVRPYVTLLVVGLHQRPGRRSLCAVMGFSGDISIARARALEASPKRRRRSNSSPRAGRRCSSVDGDPKDAKNIANAHLFINYILRPVAAALTNKVFYASQPPR